MKAALPGNFERYIFWLHLKLPKALSRMLSGLLHNTVSQGDTFEDALVALQLNAADDGGVEERFSSGGRAKLLVRGVGVIRLEHFEITGLSGLQIN